MSDDERAPKRRKSRASEQVHFGSAGMGVGPAQETESEMMASSLDLFSKVMM